MVAMVPHLEPDSDHIGNTLRGPKVRAISVGHRPLEEIAQETVFLSIRQFRWAAGCRSGTQRLPSSSAIRIAPSHNGDGTTPYAPRRLIERVSGFEPIQRS